MKKILLLLLPLALAACGAAVETTPGANALVKLSAQPNCTYLSDINSSVSIYKKADAEKMLRNQIAQNSLSANAYFISSESTTDNPSAIFGPEHTYNMTAKLYHCNKVN